MGGKPGMGGIPGAGCPLGAGGMPGKSDKSLESADILELPPYFQDVALF
ncbi:hypothetical protein [Allorhizobium ampelinum]|nr:hypothetical protein [Allorhizobium ampelinum]